MDVLRRTALLYKAPAHPLRRDEKSINAGIEPHAMHAVIRQHHREEEFRLAAHLEAGGRTFGKGMRTDHGIGLVTLHKRLHAALRQRGDELLHGGSTLPVPREAVEQLVEVRHEVQHLQINRLHEPCDPCRIALREVDDRHARLRFFARKRRRQSRRRFLMS